jgi:hypothetical protein
MGDESAAAYFLETACGAFANASDGITAHAELEQTSVQHSHVLWGSRVINRVRLPVL